MANPVCGPVYLMERLNCAFREPVHADMHLDTAMEAISRGLTEERATQALTDARKVQLYKIFVEMVVILRKNSEKQDNEFLKRFFLTTDDHKAKMLIASFRNTLARVMHTPVNSSNELFKKWDVFLVQYRAYCREKNVNVAWDEIFNHTLGASRNCNQHFNQLQKDWKKGSTHFYDRYPHLIASQNVLPAVLKKKQEK